MYSCSYTLQCCFETFRAVMSQAKSAMEESCHNLGILWNTDILTIFITNYNT